MPQPYLVPTRLRWSRSTHRSGMSSGASTWRDCPLIVRVSISPSPRLPAKSVHQPNFILGTYYNELKVGRRRRAVHIYGTAAGHSPEQIAEPERNTRRSD